MRGVCPVPETARDSVHAGEDAVAVSDVTDETGETVPAVAVRLHGLCVVAVAVAVPGAGAGAGVNVGVGAGAGAGALKQAIVSLGHDQDLATSAFPLYAYHQHLKEGSAQLPCQ